MFIVITDSEFPSLDIEREVAEQEHVQLVTAHGLSPEEVITNAAGADGLAVQYAQITADVFDALPTVKAVARFGIGVDNIDVGAATERGVVVCNVQDYSMEAVSDHTIGLALAVGRGIVVLDRGVRAGQSWLRRVQPVYQVANRIFGVVGYGAIGKTVARKASGLGYRVVVNDVVLQPGTATGEGYPVLGFRELLEKAQVVSMHVPLVPATYHLIDEAAFECMRPDAILINTSRGGIVDTDALVSAVSEGRIFGAGVDVFETERLAAGHPLTTLDRVVLSPHVAYYSEESYEELKRRTMYNVIHAVAGRDMHDVVNPEVLAHRRAPITTPD
jgi:D-3-phosphoglycerate dehydrogenase